MDSLQDAAPSGEANAGLRQDSVRLLDGRTGDLLDSFALHPGELAHSQTARQHKDLGWQHWTSLLCIQALGYFGLHPAHSHTSACLCLTHSIRLLVGSTGDLLDSFALHPGELAHSHLATHWDSAGRCLAACL